MSPRSDVSRAAAKKKTTKTAVARQVPTTPKPEQSATTTSQALTPDVSPEQRHQMIAELAYLRAEKRGFQGGDPLVDWVEAEREIDRELRGDPH